MTDEISLTGLDFSQYKETLKNYLKTQTRFKDYDFEGSNMSNLLDLLSYNTFFNNFYNNMVLSEMFMDSAKLRSSITSHAKTLNYIPRSKRASVATVKVTLKVTDNAPFVVIPARTAFNSVSVNSSGSSSYKFYTLNSSVVIPENGIYTSDAIEIYEGVLRNEKFFASYNEEKLYPIGNEDVDTTTMRVFVTNSSGIEEEYTLANSLSDLSPTSKIYFLQLSNDTYEIYFGRNVFGYQPKQNTIIRIEYISTNGSDGNGICKFSSIGKISNYNVTSVYTVTNASGGSNIETDSSIKFNASKYYQTQDRAVTENDYELLLKNNFPEIKDLSVIGGEEVYPPEYGKVYVYVDLKSMDGVSENIKSKIETFIKPRMPVGIKVAVGSPEFFYLDVKTNVIYNPNKTAKTTADVKNNIYSCIKSYFNNNLNIFGSKFYQSKFESEINDCENSIVSNSCDIRIYCEKELLINERNDFSINFGIKLTPITDYAYRAFASENPNIASLPNLTSNPDIRPPTVSSSYFVYNGVGAYIRDNGSGVLQIVRPHNNVEKILNKKIGIVDYNTGVITINKLTIDNYNGSGVKFYIVPANKDFSLNKKYILGLRNEDIKITVKTE